MTLFRKPIDLVEENKRMVSENFDKKVRAELGKSMQYANNLHLDGLVVSISLRLETPREHDEAMVYIQSNFGKALREQLKTADWNMEVKITRTDDSGQHIKYGAFTLTLTPAQ
jgi:hypothetical protein